MLSLVPGDRATRAHDDWLPTSHVFGKRFVEFNVVLGEYTRDTRIIIISGS